MTTKIHTDAINALAYGHHGAPFEVLGPHAEGKNKVAIRTMRPDASKVYVVERATENRTAMIKIRDQGIFEAVLPGDPEKIDYYFEVEYTDGSTQVVEDPYRFDTLMTELELHLFGEGRYRESYEKFGAHACEVDGVTGVHFVVWAPNALRVSVVGDFNQWDERQNPMRRCNEGGVWELFIPDLGVGTVYKFHIRSQHMGYEAMKSDPYAFSAELRPNNGSVVADLTTYEWNDDEWMESRAQKDTLAEPMVTYEVHLGSWRRNGDDEWLTYRELADQLVSYVKEMNYTHIELMPVAEHPFDGSWGYQVTGYYAPTSRYGSPQDFMYFVDKCHQAGIGVILDWVPAHFPKDGWALSYFDGTHLYSHSDSRQGEHPDWGTYIFNYGRNEVRNFLISNALFWLNKYHIDGLRVDAVSSMLYLNFGREEGEWIPNEHGGNENLDAIEFMKEANAVLHAEHPGAVTIAEESTSWPMVSRPVYIGGLGFTLKWNMGWMHDTLKYMQKDSVYRRYHHNQLTFSLMYAFSENFVLALSHDEVVHGKGSIMNKMSGDWWQQFATNRLLHGYHMTHPGKKLTFMGQEIGQWREWSEERSLDWHLLDESPYHGKLQTWVRDMNRLVQEEASLYELDFTEEGFQWIEPNDADRSVFSYIRYAKNQDDFLIFVGNFTPVPRYDYRLGVPKAGFYREVLNSDSEHYGGSNVGNDGGIHTDDYGWHGFDYSLSLTVPPLGCVILKF
jgi:1,4-alpha-glucan branching enzyme